MEIETYNRLDVTSAELVGELLKGGERGVDQVVEGNDRSGQRSLGHSRRRWCRFCCHCACATATATT